MRKTSATGNIKLSFSCPQNWDAMTPDENGRFCSECQKSVIDFRDKDEKFIKRYLSKNGSVCGRFSLGQLQPKNNFTKIFNKLMIAGGLVAVSCDPFEADIESSIQSEQKHEIIAEEKVPLLGMISEMPPTYKYGGEEGMLKILKQHLKCPDMNVAGLVVAKFTVTKDGKVEGIKIVKSLSSEADKEVVRVAELLQFDPAVTGGEQVAFEYILLVRFNM